MKKITSFLLTLIFASLVFSCKKKEDPTPQQKITGKWKVLTKTYTLEGLTENADACKLDDTNEFLSSGTYISDEGATKCDSEDPQTSTGTWALSPNGKTLTLSETTGGLVIALEVLELTNTSLKVKASVMGVIINTTMTKM